MADGNFPRRRVASENAAMDGSDSKPNHSHTNGMATSKNDLSIAVLGSEPIGGYTNPTYTDDGGQYYLGGRNLDVSGYEEEEKLGCFMAGVEKVQTTISGFYTKNKRTLTTGFYILLVLLYAAYFAYAIYYTKLEDEDSIRLYWVTCAVIVIATLQYFWEVIVRCLTPCCNVLGRRGDMISWVVVIFIYVGFITFVIADAIVISKHPENLWSGLGIITYLIILFVFSNSPSKVKWRPVVWGIGIQMVLALVILRWNFGYEAFKWLGDRAAEFLVHTDAGSKFVFDEVYYERHYFAFKVLPVVIFFSSVVSVLYYLGAMQAVIKVIAAVMQSLMGTTAAESVNAAGNIFIGQSEAPLLIRPFLKDMTKSELHAVITGGFATIAGTVMAAYIMLGVKANHLISASVMSAPAALAAAKLFYPEIEKSKMGAKSKNVIDMEPSPERNMIEAASSGASTAISLAANIAANLIAFIAILHFLNATLAWFGERVGVFDLSFELVLSYLLWPFAFLMGVDTIDCRTVAELIGVKTILNEFVAYERLSVLVNNKHIREDWVDGMGMATTMSNKTIYLNGTATVDTGHVSEAFLRFIYGAGESYPSGSVNLTGPYYLDAGMLTDRSEVIATYALCGFANFGSIGIMLGGLGALCPERKPDVAEVVVRAMIAGNIACFMTACISGLLYIGELS